VANDLELTQEFLGGGGPARELDRHHPAKAVHQGLGRLVIGMGREPRIMHPTNLLSVAAPLGDAHRVFVVTLDAYVERLDSALE
jgi:hypothetical protein